MDLLNNRFSTQAINTFYDLQSIYYLIFALQEINIHSVVSMIDVDGDLLPDESVARTLYEYVSPPFRFEESTKLFVFEVPSTLESRDT